jgi:hypothetical protein
MRARGRANCGMQITRILSALFLSLALLSVGCSGSSDSISKKDGSDDGPCTITLSGDVTGTVSCTVAVLYDGPQKLTQFGLTVQQSEPTAAAFAKIAGTAQTGTFTDANCVECFVSASAKIGNPPPTWAMQLKPTKQGSFSVTIKSLGTGSSGPNGGVAYADPHGTATAVLPALQETGATGTVNLSAKF